jgi:hypothetical protein
MSIIIDNQELYSIINLTDGNLEWHESQRILDELNSEYAIQVMNLILDAQGIEHLNLEGLNFVKKGTELVVSRGGIYVVAGASVELQTELESLGAAVDVTFLPTVAEGIDAVFFHDLEKQFGLEGGDINLL